MRAMVLLLVLLFTSCIELPAPVKQKSAQQRIKEIKSLDMTPLLDVSASINDLQRGDGTAVNFSDFGYHVKTKYGFLLLDEKGMKSIRYDRWMGPKMSSSTLNAIHYCLMDVGLESIKVDSCGNTFFSLYNKGKGESYAIVKNKECLTARDTLLTIVIR